MKKYCLIQTTCSQKEEAEKLARGLIDKKLAACVQLSSPVTSYYSWQGNLQVDQEYVLSIKTSLEKFAQIETFLYANHSYDVPEVILISLDEIGSRYLAWLDSEVN